MSAGREGGRCDTAAAAGGGDVAEGGQQGWRRRVVMGVGVVVTWKEGANEGMAAVDGGGDISRREPSRDSVCQAAIADVFRKNCLFRLLKLGKIVGIFDKTGKTKNRGVT